ncbi:MAG: carbohydrate-binding domain-containing protein [Bacteroidales bacterium]|nr:carbohydrate-binding domain-containing protein [Bacteroidales bacterium]
MKRLFLVISLIFIGLSVKAQDGEYHVRIHGQENKGVVLDAPATSVDSMYVNSNNKLKVRTTNNLYSFSFDEIDSLTFPWVPTSTGDIVYINYNGTSVEIDNPYSSSGVNITASEAKVTINSTSSANITYCLSGTANPGRFEIESVTTPTIKLNGVNLTNPTGKAMDLTCEAGIIMQLANGTQNSLADGTTSDKKAALMSNNDLLVQGEGTLTVTGLVQHAMKVKGQFNMNSGNLIIASSVADGIHTEGLLVQGGSITVESCGDDGITSELDGYINGGNITITSGSTDINAISADSTLVINGGNINITVTGVDSKCIKADKELTINGGTFVLNHSGNTSKGIKSDADITITDGDITITSSGATVIANNDPSYCTAIKGETNIYISGGTFNINLPSSNNGGKGITCNGDMIISGNNTINIETHGDGSTYTATSGTDTYSSSCLRAEGNMQILSGDITLTSTGKAGKGIKVGSKNGNTYTGTYTQGNTDGTGPTLTITTSGAQVGSSGGWPGPGGGSSSSRASAKAIKSGGVATVYGGTTDVHTSTSGAEGLESKTQINIEGGQHYFKCYDDCINSSGKIFFNGGVTVCFSNGNDAVDSNAGQAGAITIGNGVAFAYTTKGSPEEGFDCDNNNYIRITGTGIGLSAGGSQGGGGWPGGGGGSGGTITDPAQGYKFYTSSYTFQAGKYYTLSNASGTGGTNMVTFSFEANCTSNLALITATGMVSGQTYYVKYGNDAPTNPTTAFHGLYLGGTSSASTQAFSFQAQ